MTFLQQGAVVGADGATPDLDAGEDAGVLDAVRLPDGHLLQVCGFPPRGMVRDLRDGQLTTATEGDSIHIQTCVSAAAGNCEIDL